MVAIFVPNPIPNRAERSVKHGATVAAMAGRVAMPLCISASGDFPVRC